jgi:hypothetical protein
MHNLQLIINFGHNSAITNEYSNSNEKRSV